MERKRHFRGLITGIILLVIIAGAVGLGVWKRQWIYDFYRGMTYVPSDEMVRIMGDLRLTERGEFLFKAAQPELSEREEFNEKCRGDDTEIAVLGCYTGGDIYVYNIKDTELDGIRELTTAHELLHVVWARMSEEERLALAEPLTRTFEENQEMLEKEINSYDVSQKQEELYVRAGTEVADLPDVLEKHYAEIFKDQDSVVAFYNSYIGVFRVLEEELEALKDEMNGLNQEITQKIAEYEKQVAQLNADIVSFNSCAEVAGCFGSSVEFNEERARLVAWQKEIDRMYEEISGLVENYNEKVDKYNADVTRTEKLNRAMNSKNTLNEIK